MIFSNKCSAQLTLNKIQTNSDYFDFSQLFWSISVYLGGFFQANYGYLGMLGLMIKYELSNSKHQ